MRKSSLFIISATLVMTCAVVAIAQDAKLEVPAKRHFKHNTKIQAKYDRSKDQTMVYVDPYHWSQPVPYFDLLENVVLTAGFRYSGKTLTSMPQWVEFGVITNSRLGWFFGENKEIKVTADGEELFSGTLNMVSKNRPNAGTYVEILSIGIPTEMFLKIVNSKTVEMRAGPQVQFKLKTEHMEAFRDLASRMKP